MPPYFMLFNYPTSKEFHLSFGANCEAGCRCRYKDALALMDVYRIAVVVGDCSLAYGANENYERVELGKWHIILLCQTVDVCCEVTARYKLCALVGLYVVVCAVIGKYCVVDGRLAHLCMQFAWVAAVVATVEVIYAVGDVRCLLNLGNERAGTN